MIIIIIKTKIINIYVLYFLCCHIPVWVCRSMWTWGKLSAKAKEGRESPELESQAVMSCPYELPGTKLQSSEGAVSVLCHWAILPSLKVGFFIETWCTYYILAEEFDWVHWALALFHSVFRDELAQNPYPSSAEQKGSLRNYSQHDM